MTTKTADRNPADAARMDVDRFHALAQLVYHVTIHTTPARSAR